MKMNNKPIISLCIPTNGVLEWISHVIDSIYAQGVGLDKFEVVIVDNGKNHSFFEYVQGQMKIHPNIRYKRIKCPIFMNEIETYKMAQGVFIKFINHRTLLLEGTLAKWISFIEENYDDKPIVYFSNGVLDKFYCDYKFDRFEDFISNLSYWSSWSTGMAIWKEDLEQIDFNGTSELFPHTIILFRNWRGRDYIIDNRIYLSEIPHTSKNKGKYDLFYAFSVEYPTLLLNLYRNKDISIDTFLKLKKEAFDFIMECHRLFCEEMQECSYDLDSFDNNIEVFFSKDYAYKRTQEKKDEFEKELRHRMNRSKAIYGAGVGAYKLLMNMGTDDVICFIDKDQSLWGTMRLGIPIIGLEQFIQLGVSAEILISLMKKEIAEEIRQDLKEMGLSNIKTLFELK